MTYKQILTREMYELSRHPKVRFIGYNVAYGPRFNGTLNRVPKSKCIEMPVAENLIMGVAMGLSLEGYRPIVCIERTDFLLVCADAIINHLCKLPKISNDQFNFAVIIRTCVGGVEPLDPGPQHTQDLGYMFAPYMDVSGMKQKSMIHDKYTQAMCLGKPTMLIEYRELYDT